MKNTRIEFKTELKTNIFSKMKKVKLIVAVVVLTGLSFCAKAQVSWSLNSTFDTLTISGSGAMTNYGWGNAPWYPNHTQITTIIIANGVTTIGNGAFAECSNLTSVTIPNSVTIIENGAFFDCSNLDTVTIPSNVTYIGEETFKNCISLRSITIPRNVTFLGESAFGYCTNLSTIYFNATNCTGLDINGIFYNCSAVTGFHIGSNVTYIPEGTFIGLTGLQVIYIPDSVTRIDDGLQNCFNLTDIYVGAGNLNYSTIDGILYDKMQDTLIFCPSGKTGNIDIPFGVKVIGVYAFYGDFSYGISSVTIPSSVTSIENYAFHSCKNLTLVTIPSGVTSIEISAFYRCTSLQTVNFNATNCTSAGYSLFYNCSAFTTLNIGCNVTNIPANAFNGCSALRDIYSHSEVPPTVANANAFTNVSKTSCVLHIPAGTTAAYNAAGSTWNTFTNKVEDVAKQDTIIINDTICYGEIYNLNGFNFVATLSNTYFNNDFNINGCDSVTRLNLMVYQKQDTVIFSDTVLDGITYNRNGFNFVATASGRYFNNDFNINGCDSVTQLNLTVKKTYTISGTVTHNGNLLSGVAIIYNNDGDSVVTGAIGFYTLTVESNANVTLLPRKSGYSFNPPYIVCNNVLSNLVNQDFTATKEVGIVETHCNASLRIYPNPTNSQLRIENYELRDGEIEIYDVVGRLQYIHRHCGLDPQSPANNAINNEIAGQARNDGSGISIDISHLANGLYFLKIGNKTVKIIKN